MINLPTTFPDDHEYLAYRNFSTQVGNDNSFDCIPMDQTIEKIINKDNQTPGGTKGFSTKKGTCRGITLQQITENLSLDNSDT